MKHQHFDVETAGFYGAYWACADGSDCAVIAMIGDDPEDRLARSAVKWLCGRRRQCAHHVACESDYGFIIIRWRRVETAISWLKAACNHKKSWHCWIFDFTERSLTAAAMFPDVTLTIAMTPSDFVAGFHAGQKGRLQGMAGRGRVAVLPTGQAVPGAVLLSASRLLALRRRGISAHWRQG